jgi:hypothetical protein
MTEVINVDAKTNIQSEQETKKPYMVVDPKLPINDLSRNEYEEIPVNNVEEKISPQAQILKTDHPKLLKDIGSDDPLEYLNLAKSAVISQWMDKHVFLSGCEPSIRYVITITTYSEEKKKIFNCREVHNWCQKNCIQLIFLILVGRGENSLYRLTKISKNNQRMTVV